ncbi:putative membrane protein YagU involved in acid resistance [Flavobacterium nitrogenifigens]|uniref:Membrane protein YagU involved in acid resistance n=2 Tax=Flavobacterium TaxID=237 RepID=A0ABR6QC73_9FLAO|nr:MULTISPECIES: DUF1440 domain-containing protein [Flavobacterium]MBB4801851.1 putative membrane protein YagU involved in acid resistance [Flavobacterium nitrogenifigens]MBB6386809.1 putative membrane protein YagU involved in acid resistance [Flavobacterium notoginsengisoli]
MRSKVRTIVSSGLVAGTLDITAAILIYSVILHKTTAEKILQSIASGIFKKEAYTAGAEMTFAGLGLHFLIAFIFAWFYFKIFPYIPFFRINTFLSGLCYGFFIWIVMNLIVLPIVFPVLPEKNLDFALLLSILIIIFCVGMPIAFITRKYYAKWY